MRRNYGLGNLGDRWGDDPTLNISIDQQYANKADEIAPGIVDYAKQIMSIGESLVSAISRARLSVAMTDQQRALLDVQLARAEQGLPPLQTTGYVTGGGNQATVNNNTLMLLGLGLVVLIVMTRK